MRYESLLFLLVLAAIVIHPSAAFAEMADDCQEAFGDPFVQQILKNEGGAGASALSTRNQGEYFLSRTCPSETLKEIMAELDWIFVEENVRDEPFTAGYPRQYTYDRMIYFCRTGRSLFTLYGRGCVEDIRFFTLEDKITNVIAGASK